LPWKYWTRDEQLLTLSRKQAKGTPADVLILMGVVVWRVVMFVYIVVSGQPIVPSGPPSSELSWADRLFVVLGWSAFSVGLFRWIVPPPNAKSQSQGPLRDVVTPSAEEG
jgi:hypothetical protein